jgi:hypothetical protein
VYNAGQSRGSAQRIIAEDLIHLGGMMMKQRWILISVACLIVLGIWFLSPISRIIAAPPQPTDCTAETYNLLRNSNCGFENSMPDSYWETTNLYVTIAPTSTQVHDGTYSLGMTGTSAWGVNFSAGSQTIKTSNPVAVTGGSTYSFVAWAYIPSTATRVSAARLRLAWYAAADCSGTQLSTSTQDVTTTDAWTYVWLSATAPATASCAQLRLLILTPASGTGAVGPVYLDNVMFYRSNATAITLRSMNATASTTYLVLPVALVLASLVAIIILRRRSRAA